MVANIAALRFGSLNKPKTPNRKLQPLQEEFESIGENGMYCQTNQVSELR
jgi:hypothetical protein